MLTRLQRLIHTHQLLTVQIIPLASPIYDAGNPAAYGARETEHIDPSHDRQAVYPARRVACGP
jgi:hypothetical protein